MDRREREPLDRISSLHSQPVPPDNNKPHHPDGDEGRPHRLQRGQGDICQAGGRGHPEGEEAGHSICRRIRVALDLGAKRDRGSGDLEDGGRGGEGRSAWSRGGVSRQTGKLRLQRKEHAYL